MRFALLLGLLVACTSDFQRSRDECEARAVGFNCTLSDCRQSVFQKQDEIPTDAACYCADLQIQGEPMGFPSCPGSGGDSSGGCCKVCETSCACGDSCISCRNRCHAGAGCACDG